ncbi:hypothetical protein ACNHYB_03740 [Isoptericola jiangsuensis]|uniref:hypothetical protein n=1 Tax=Isoptericola jiangsuensis TaxID=548579 RepID=UPI003AAC8E63
MIESAVRGMMADEWYVILEIAGGCFIQASKGVEAGVLSGQFAVEYRKARESGQYRLVFESIEGVIEAFAEFFRDSNEWQPSGTAVRVQL